MINKKKINAEIVADSINPQGNRITTFLLTYPRMIHGELMTHRLFSRNSASSRAIPFKTMVKSIMDDPFIPIAWQKDHKGMQGTEYITDQKMIDYRKAQWLIHGRDRALDVALLLNKPVIEHRSMEDEPKIVSDGITKQLCNRLLEPFAWHTVLVTATEFDNFFELRCPQYKLIGIGGGPVRSRKEWLEKMKLSSALHPSQYPKTEEDWWKLSESGAEIHIQALAEAMWDSLNSSTPVQLMVDEWHMPFASNFEVPKILEISGYEPEDFELVCRKIATARAARLSYMTFDGEINYEKDIELHDMLLESKHFSPFEHCCKVGNAKEISSIGNGFTHADKNGKLWSGNVKGFIQYRHMLEK